VCLCEPLTTVTKDIESGRTQDRLTSQRSGNAENNVLTSFYEDVDSVKALIEKLKLQTKAVAQKHRYVWPAYLLLYCTVFNILAKELL